MNPCVPVDDAWKHLFIHSVVLRTLNYCMESISRSWQGGFYRHLKSIRIRLIESTYVVARGRVVSIMQCNRVPQRYNTSAGFVDLSVWS